MIVLIVVAALISLVASLLVYARWNHGTLEKLGIPVIVDHPLLGSVKATHEEAGALKDIEWIKKYGQVFGVYEGREPQLFVCDAELVREICVKSADSFNDKRRFDFASPLLNEMPDFLPPEKWKLVRQITTPGFSNSKIKLMNLPMRLTAEDFVADIKDEIRAGKGRCEKFAVDKAIHTMLTDLVSRCIFSIDINNRNNKNNRFVQLVAELFSPAGNPVSHQLVLWSYTFPFLQKLFANGTQFSSAAAEEFAAIFRMIVQERKNSGVVKNDVVDLYIEWHDKLDTPEFKKAKITEATLMCQILVYFFAGQDQISTIISSTLYHITKDPELEKKIYEEVDAVFARHNGKIEHEHLNELVHLNACLNESLRLYPFFYRTERVCTKEWKCEKYGFTIPKGLTVILPIWAINRNPEYVEYPEDYYPSRWLPENKDKMNVYSSTSFGHGPRACTGKRFATEALPMVAAYMLKDLKFFLRKDSEISFVPGGPLLAPHNPIYLDVVERSSAAPSY